MDSYIRNANRLTIFLYVVLLLVSAAGAIWLPDSVAIHYKLDGKPDRWGNPASLLILPFIVFFLLGIIWATDKAHPDFMNFPGPRTPDNVSRQLRNVHRMSATLRPFLTLFFSLFRGNPSGRNSIIRIG